MSCLSVPAAPSAESVVVQFDFETAHFGSSEPAP